MQFDPEKAKSNLLKHHVDFRSAIKVLDDPNRLVYFDNYHSSSTEKRWLCRDISS